MPRYCLRRLPLTTAILALGWGCASEPSGPSAKPDPNSAAITTAATYTVRSLGTLGGNFSQAFGINDANMVVGTSNLAGNTETHAFVWRNGVMTDLGTLTGGRQSEARAINGEGVIVGWSLNQAGFMRAVRWMNGNKRTLGTLHPLACFWFPGHQPARCHRWLERDCERAAARLPLGERGDGGPGHATGRNQLGGYGHQPRRCHRGIEHDGLE